MIEHEIKNLISLAGSAIVNILDIDSYIQKMLTYSSLISIIEHGKLQGFISYYNNDPDKENAFLTLIAIHPDYQGKGIGKKLLSFSIVDLEEKKIKNYSLEVLKDNTTAIALYNKFGFKIQEDKDTLWVMKLEL